MGFFGFGNKAVVQQEDTSGEIYSFSTTFMKIKEGNLALPFVDKFTTKSAGAIYFGIDNLFPQKLDQYYYTSPMHGAIIDFKKNATIGGGYELTPKSDGMDTLLKINTFKNIVKLDKLVDKLCMADELHYRAYILIRFRKEKGGLKPEDATWVEPSKVRVNQSKSHVFISNDWSRSLGVKPVPVYDPNCTELLQCFVYEVDTPGQDYYPIPRYASANNWIFLDGEESYLQKTNIIESIFPSFALFFPKKPQGDKEIEAVQTSVNKAKGAQHAGRIFTFFAGKKEEMPELKEIPKNNNDNLFSQTSQRIDIKICQAHTIDPILMGVRISGSLGNGSDIKQSYVIFEKNDITPRRKRIELFVNNLMRLFGTPANFTINNYQIISETIVEDGGAESSKKILETLQKVSPLVANKIIEKLTDNEIRGIADLPNVIGGNRIQANQPPQQQGENTTVNG
mgnify:FL=1